VQEARHGVVVESDLEPVLTDEISRRESTATARRAEVAGLDPGMTFERWDKSSKVTYDRRGWRR
jgi:hypothetical protein